MKISLTANADDERMHIWATWENLHCVIGTGARMGFGMGSDGGGFIYPFLRVYLWSGGVGSGQSFYDC